MKLIAFSKNKWTDDIHFMVSDEIYDKVKDFKWCAKKSGYYGYLCIGRRTTLAELADGWPTAIIFSRYIFDLKKGNKAIVDHKNGWLNNTFESLRLTNVENNSRYRKGNKRNLDKTKHLPKGVRLSNRIQNPYRATIGVHGKYISLGNYPTPELAHKAYCNAAVKYFGEFAKFK